MEERLTRRAVITGLAAGALVVGLDPVTGNWVTEASASDAPRDLPRLDGRVRLDGATRDGVADDFGHLVHRRPIAVLEAGSVDDIETMVRYCRRHDIPVAARGQGHATNGQAQVAQGLVIDMSGLNDIEISGDHANVQAGALWSELLHASLPQKLTPPVLTDYLELSIGGTLSAGGVGGATHQHGAQVDNVAELDVVTGTGERVNCSPDQHADLFHAVLSGLGQCGIITRATVRLLPAPVTVRHYQLFYPSLAALTKDQRKVVRDGRFDYVEGQVQAPPDGSPGWLYLLEAVTFTHKEDGKFLGDLAYTRGTEQINDLAYFDFLNRLAPSVEYLKEIGEWARPHPWLNVFLPDSTTDALVEDVIAHLTPADIGLSGVILLYPVRHRLLRTPLLRVPDEDLVFLFTLLKTASPGAKAPAAMVADNRTLYEQVQAAGGTQYPVGTIPTSHADWRRHFGSHWPRLQAAKRRYDPAGILAPGQGIF
ncbi:MAG TPA: FAD-binding protein [Actinoallomurus sp.]|jgi:FAD/FMN-containing dehydrogenase